MLTQLLSLYVYLQIICSQTIPAKWLTCTLPSTREQDTIWQPNCYSHSLHCWKTWWVKSVSCSCLHWQLIPGDNGLTIPSAAITNLVLQRLTSHSTTNSGSMILGPRQPQHNCCEQSDVYGTRQLGHIIWWELDHNTCCLKIRNADILKKRSWKGLLGKHRHEEKY